MVFLYVIAALLASACDLIRPDDPSPKEPVPDAMYVYSNFGPTFYLVDYEKYEVVREIEVKAPSAFHLYDMKLSTDREHLVFSGYGQTSASPFGFAVYDLAEQRLEVFDTGFTMAEIGNAYYIAAEDEAAPGLFYVDFREAGTYAVDMYEQRVTEKLSDEHDIGLTKWIYHSPDQRWTVVLKKWARGHSFSELAFYAGDSRLGDLEFTLNASNRDSISIYDFAFSEDGKELFLTYQLSGARSRDVESYFGSYDLETQELTWSEITFPWSLNPYYMAYSARRDEVYTIGAYDVLYIIDAESKTVADTIVLTGKVRGPSQIQLAPDEGIAFVSCPDSGAMYVVDLERREVVHVIRFDQPYNMIIP